MMHDALLRLSHAVACDCVADSPLAWRGVCDWVAVVQHALVILLCPVSRAIVHKLQPLSL